MTIAILKKRDIPNDDLVVIPRKEYETLKAFQVPAVFLKGRAAKKLDRRVARALHEYQSGALTPIKSLRELL